MTFFDPVNSLNGWHCHPHLVGEIEPQGGEGPCTWSHSWLAAGLGLEGRCSLTTLGTW